MSPAEIGEVPGAGARPGSAVARIMLGGHLRRHREAAGIVPDEAAWHIRASRAKISRLETGRARCKERDVLDLLALYGVDDAEVVAGLLVLVSQARTQDWWADFSDVLPAWFEPYLGMENSASVIRAFDLQFVCGLFQTENYARAVTVLGHRDARAGEIERRVAVRMKRQELLADADPPKVWAVLDEAALRRPVGGAAVMRGQVRRLLEAAEMPAVTLQVLPFAAGGHDAGGTFMILRFAERDIPDVVYIEQLTGATYADKPDAVDHHRDVMNRLSTSALTPAQTAGFLAGMLREM
jgi:Domain of unknown function (DUF5753)/Helix-turn-helix domain